MGSVFAKILLGHLTGDYLLQNKIMALRKSEKSWEGFWWCNLHCLIYTFSVCLFLWTINPIVVILVFLSHWPIDRWSLANKWLKFIKGRDIEAAFHSKDKYREIDIVFSCVVYAATDNTMHLILLWLITTNLRT